LFFSLVFFLGLRALHSVTQIGRDSVRVELCRGPDLGMPEQCLYTLFVPPASRQIRGHSSELERGPASFHHSRGRARAYTSACREALADACPCVNNASGGPGAPLGRSALAEQKKSRGERARVASQFTLPNTKRFIWARLR
jgi:hypothetical protein